jgi:hypothetical protein
MGFLRLGVGLSQVLVLAIVPCAYAADAPPAAEVQAIRRVVLDYLEGWHTGDAARMQRALHPELVKRRPQKDEAGGQQRLQPIDAPAMIRLTAAGAGRLKDGELMDNRIEVLDVAGDIATAKATSLRYIDYLHLARWDGAWKIVNVLWEPRAQATSGRQKAKAPAAP